MKGSLYISNQNCSRDAKPIKVFFLPCFSQMLAQGLLKVYSDFHHKTDKIKPTDKHLSRQQLKGIIFQFVGVQVWKEKKRIMHKKPTNSLGFVHLILVLKEQEDCLKLFTACINWENVYAATKGELQNLIFLLSCKKLLCFGINLNKFEYKYNCWRSLEKKKKPHQIFLGKTERGGNFDDELNQKGLPKYRQ